MLLLQYQKRNRTTSSPLEGLGHSTGKTETIRRPEEAMPANKQQKVAAVKTMDTDTARPLWEDSESDF